MNLTQIIFATATASEELPDSWYYIAFAAFTSAVVLSFVLLVVGIVARTRIPWFYPVAAVALVAGGVGLGFGAYVYKIEYVAVGFDGTKASPPIWQALWLPSLPILASLTAMVIRRIRTA